MVRLIFSFLELIKILNLMKKYFKNGSKEDDVADDNISIKLFPQTFARMKEGNKN